MTQKILPDDPSEKNFSAKVIKETNYKPDITLYDLITEVATEGKNLNSLLESAQDEIESIKAKDTITDADINDLKSRVSAVETSLTNYKSRIETLEKNYTTLNTNLNSEITRAKSEETRIEGKFDSSVADIKSVIANNVKKVDYNTNTGTWTYTHNNGTTTVVDTNVEKLGLKLSYDSVNEQLVFESTDGTKAYIPLSSITNSIQKIEIVDDELNEGNILIKVTGGEPNATTVTKSIASFEFVEELETALNSLTTRVSKNETDIKNLQDDLADLESRSVLDSDLTTNTSDEVDKINNKAIHASTADKATADKNGKDIADTYHTKADAKTDHNALTEKITKNADDIANEVLNRKADVQNLSDKIRDHFIANPEDYDESTAIGLSSMKVNGVIYKGMKGDKGDTGQTGQTGLPAGFGIPQINIETLAPGVPAEGSVSASGPDTAKVFRFDLKIPQGPKGDTGAKGDKGEQGDKGDTGNPADIAQVNVSVDNQYLANPTATAEVSGPSEGKIINIAFKGIRGEPGAPGTYSKTYSSVEEMNAGYATDGLDVGALVIINDNTEGSQDNGSVYIKGDSSYQFVANLQGNIGPKGDTGAQGPQGVGISSITKQGTSGLVDTYLITLTNGNSYTFTVTNGEKGDDGITPEISPGEVNTLPSGSNAVVTFSGTKTNVIINFGIPRGPTGPKGENGATPILQSISVEMLDSDASPSATITETSEGSGIYNLNLKLPRGIQGIQGPQGATGLKGDTGATGPAGANGATFTPSVDASGNLSWTNDKNLANPNTVNIKGPIGQTGPQGPAGDAGNLGPLPNLSLNTIFNPTSASPRIGYSQDFEEILFLIND